MSAASVPAIGDPYPTAPIGRVLADAVRRQLTHPGSVSPQRQLELYLADRAGTDPVSDPAGRQRREWTPFLAGMDPCPYRPLAEGSWDHSISMV